MSSNGNYGPTVPLCRLYERISKSGNHYLTGRLGAAKVVVLKSSDTTDDGTPIWNVLLQEAPAKRDGHDGAQRSNADADQRQSDDAPRAANGKQPAPVDARDW